MNNRSLMLADVLRSGANRLKLGGIHTPELDAKILFQHASGYSAVELISNSQNILSASIVANYEKFIDERIAGKPVHRITCSREFYGRAFVLNDATLIPRPDTETLIDAVLDHYKHRKGQLSVLDLGTGSGVLAVTLASELENTTVTAVDISSDALKAARINAQEYNVKDKIDFIQSDMFAVVQGKYDLIVSNPPYIPTADIKSLQQEVQNYDPRLALDGGEDGLNYYREIFTHAQAYLNKGGFVFVEIGIGQSDAIMEIANTSGFMRVSKINDLSDIYRVIAASN